MSSLLRETFQRARTAVPRWVFTGTLLCLALVSTLQCMAEVSGAPSDQIRKLEEDLSREKDKYLKFDIKEKNILGRLSAIERQIAEKEGLLKTLREEIRSRKEELEGRYGKLREVEEEISAIRDELSSKLVSYYKHARRGYVKLLATAADLDELRKRMHALKIIMAEDRKRIRGMLDIFEKHREAVDSVQHKVEAVERLEKEESDQIARLNEEQKKKVLLLMKIHKEKEFYETAVKELKTAAESLKETLSGLDKNNEKRVNLNSDFAEYKGKLPLPYEGKIIRDYHPLDAGSVTTHRGIFIQGRERGPVRAVYDGIVDYSGWLKGYGQIVILNHGSRFFSVSAHLSEIKRLKGDMVGKGEVIGLAGDSESLSGPGLYFELRKAGEPVDPLLWLKED